MADNYSRIITRVHRVRAGVKINIFVYEVQAVLLHASSLGCCGPLPLSGLVY